MKTRHDKIVEVIQQISNEFVVDRYLQNKKDRLALFEILRGKTIEAFKKWGETTKKYLAHPDSYPTFYKATTSITEHNVLGDLYEKEKEKFYKLALRVMIMDTRANDIERKITSTSSYDEKIDGWYETIHWRKLEEDESLSQEAWAYIGKELTYRLFAEVNYNANKSKGRRAGKKNEKDTFLAMEFLRLKRCLFEELYDLAPFTDLEIIDALLSNRKDKPLRAVLTFMGVNNPPSPHRLRNKVSNGRKYISVTWLAENDADLRAKDIFDDLDYTEEELEERIKYTTEFLGTPLSDEEKEAVRLGFVTNTEFNQHLDEGDLTPFKLELIAGWKISEEQTKLIVQIAKDRFGLTCFKSNIAREKTQSLW